MDHLLIGGNPCTKFSIYQVKGSTDIEGTTLGLQTNRRTVAKQYAPFFKGGIKIIFLLPVQRSSKNAHVQYESHFHMSGYSDIVRLHYPLTKVATKSWAI